MQLQGTQYTLDLASTFLLLTNTTTREVQRINVDAIQRLQHHPDTHTLTMTWDEQTVEIVHAPEQAAGFGLLATLWSSGDTVLPFHGLARIKRAVTEAHNAAQRQWVWLGTLKGVGIIGLPAFFILAIITFTLDSAIETWPSQVFWFLSGVAFWTYGWAGVVKWALPKMGQAVTRNNLFIGSIAVSLLFNLVIGAMYLAGSSVESPPRASIPPAIIEEPLEPPLSLTIVAVEDKSQKFVPGRLSDYAIGELNERPVMTRKAYRVTVPEGFQEAQVEQAAEQLVSQVTRDDPGLDAAVFWLYSDKAHIDAGQAYDVAMITWAPGGSWGNLSDAILETNDRRGYSTKIEVEEGFEQRLAARSKDETKFGLTKAQRRQVFKAMILNEHKAEKDAEARYPLAEANGRQAYMETHVRYMDEREAYYDQQTRQQYDLSQEQYHEISKEGMNENWPHPALDEWLD